MNALHDVVVVGGRAAGAATALLLARLGHDVLVVDRAPFPSDTVSTHQLARPGVVQLNRWGLLDAVLAAGTPALRQVSFGAATRTVKHKAGVGLLLAPRRTVLDTIVLDAAERAGAHVLTGVTVDGVRFDDTGRACGVHAHTASGAPVSLSARWVVGADGLRSVVARSVGAEILEDHGDQGAAQYAYYEGLTWRGIELMAAERALAGVFPTNGGEACIWVTTPAEDARTARRRAPSRAAAFETLLWRAAPELADRLTLGRRTSAVAGMLRQPNILRRAQGPGWALVGDAGYHRDAVTGHGLSDAYRDAELLAFALDRALRGGELEDYQTRRDRALREVFDLTCAMAAYPPLPRFVELQKKLAYALDTEAEQLVSQESLECPI